jgi:phosphoribosylaminoimidazolecarboxamide formyltransferase/IMP cyclohydrolase
MGSERECADLLFAWKVCRHVKSNAIVVVRDEMTVGVGAGQMSRIDSVEVALMKADRHGHSLKGAVAASDAFFPFPDSVETLAERGITAIVSPKGARRDDEVIAACNQHGVALYLLEDRHFRH